MLPVMYAVVFMCLSLGVFDESSKQGAKFDASAELLGAMFTDNRFGAVTSLGLARKLCNLTGQTVKTMLTSILAENNRIDHKSSDDSGAGGGAASAGGEPGSLTEMFQKSVAALVEAQASLAADKAVSDQEKVIALQTLNTVFFTNLFANK